MAKRKEISTRTRFEIFKRDQFTCQYCGKKAPDVILNVDHIKPVSDGGTNHLLNLTTSCQACNGGKSDKLLSDSSAVERSRAQAELTEERRQQIKLMAEWQIELAQMNPELDAVNQALQVISKGHTLTEIGKKNMRKLLREFSVQEIIEALAIAWDQYTPDVALSKVGGIAQNLKIQREDPEHALMKKIVSKLGYRLRGPSWKRHDAVRALLSLRERDPAWLSRSREAESVAQSWDEYIEAVSA
jgi:hypothetical protein